MNIINTSLALSVILNCLTMGYIISLDHHPSVKPKSQQALAIQSHDEQPCLPVSDSNVESKLKSLRDRLALFKMENANCKQSLQSLEFQLELTKLNEDQNSNGSHIIIEDNMPDELQETIAIYSNYLEEESVDETWAQDVTTNLDTIINRSEHPDLTIITPINCRSTLCNYELATTDQNQADTIENLLKNSLLEALGGQLKLYQYAEPNAGQVRIVMYYARNGHALPELKY